MESKNTCKEMCQKEYDQLSENVDEVIKNLLECLESGATESKKAELILCQSWILVVGVDNC